MGIPVINIGPWTSSSTTSQEDRLSVAKEVSKACQDIGFFAVTNHGVNPVTMDQAWKASQDFFDLPMTEKMAWKTANEAEYPYGYEQSERLVRGKDASVTAETGETPADLKETFSIGPYNPDSGMSPRRWLTTTGAPPDFRTALEEYYEAMERLALTLLRIFAVGLGLEESWFESKMSHHLSALR